MVTRKRESPRPSTLSVLPQDLRAGDRFTDADGTEWEPTVMLGGKKHRAQVRQVGDQASIREAVWPSYLRLTVQRSEAAPLR
jgi:hypothetical protein